MNILYEQLKHYLLIALTSCFILGIILSFFAPSSSKLPVIALVICLLSTLLLSRLRYNDSAKILLCFCFALSGYYHGSQSSILVPAPDNISHLIENGQEAVLVGTLDKMVTGNSQEQKIIVEAAFLNKKDTRLLTPVSGKVVLSLKGEWPQTIAVGDTFIARGIFRHPGTAKSPGRFDYSQYLAEQEIFLTGAIRSPLLIHAIDYPLQRDAITNFRHYTERIRSHISHFLSATLKEKHAALYQAILLGDKSQIPPELLETFQISGVAHILAISGMHMALLGFFLFTLFYYITRLSPKLILTVNVRKLSLLLCILPLLLYSLLAGSNTPAVRSFIMSLIFIFAFCVNRPKSHFTIITAAALILLIYEPLSLKSASFQLSFAAVASIVLMTPKILRAVPNYQTNAPGSGFLRFLFRRTIELLAVTVSATIGTLPLLVYHFNHLSTVTLPANLIVEPLVCFWALPCGFVAIPLLYIYPPLAKTVLLFGTWSLDLATKYIFHLTTFPMSSLWLPDIGIAKISLFYVSLFFIILCHSSRTRSFAFTVLAITLFMIIAPVSGLTDKFRTSTSVSFIDVGQGSSSLLELAGGRTIIIDAGAATTPGFNCGKRIIAPYLWSLGIGRIDDIILTHADADHYNGISALLERFQPDRLWIPRHQSEKQGYNALLARAQSLGIQILHPKRETFISENLVTLSRVDNRINDKSDETSFDQVKTDDNDNSLIISFKTGDFSVLFPGDITSSKEQKLVREEGDLRHDILLSPHHGSATSNSPEFLEAVNPQYLVVSAGDNARQLFPAMATRVSAEALGITVVTTGQAGTVRVAGNDGGYVITTTSR